MEELLQQALYEASKLDGSESVNRGGAAGVYIGTSIYGGWVAKADWSNGFEIFATGKTWDESLNSLILLLKGFHD